MDPTFTPSPSPKPPRLRRVVASPISDLVYPPVSHAAMDAMGLLFLPDRNSPEAQGQRKRKTTQDDITQHELEQYRKELNRDKRGTKDERSAWPQQETLVRYHYSLEFEYS
jgi:hypothetical protein